MIFKFNKNVIKIPNEYEYVSMTMTLHLSLEYLSTYEFIIYFMQKKIVFAYTINSIKYLQLGKRTEYDSRVREKKYVNDQSSLIFNRSNLLNFIYLTILIVCQQ